jgi:thiol-disulfide isomerase/thioredoxin
VVSGKDISLHSLAAGKKASLIMFICRHCPYVKHVERELASLGNEYAKKGVAVVAISSNDIESHPDDAPLQLKRQAEEFGFAFPYGFDESQSVAKEYMAACTPDFFLFDQDLALVYRGQLDDSRPGNNLPVSGKDLRSALDTVLAGKKPDGNQKSSVGCNIKWKAGQEPRY